MISNLQYSWTYLISVASSTPSWLVSARSNAAFFSCSFSSAVSGASPGMLREPLRDRGLEADRFDPTEARRLVPRDLLGSTDLRRWDSDGAGPSADAVDRRRCGSDGAGPSAEGSLSFGTGRVAGDKLDRTASAFAEALRPAAVGPDIELFRDLGGLLGRLSSSLLEEAVLPRRIDGVFQGLRSSN